MAASQLPRAAAHPVATLAALSLQGGSHTVAQLGWYASSARDTDTVPLALVGNMHLSC